MFHEPKRTKLNICQHLQLFLKVSSIVCLSENGIFPHRDKASHVSKPSVISQRGLTTSVLAVNETTHRNLCAFVCAGVFLSMFNRVVRTGGLMFTGRRYLWHEAVKFCFTVC